MWGQWSSVDFNPSWWGLPCRSESVAQPNSFDEWKAWALAEDQRTGAERWKQDDSSHLYDHRVIRRRFDELLDVRASGDAHRLLYYLNEGLHGNMGGMGAPQLYAEAQFGTKQLITDYISELAGALEDFENSSAVDRATKLGYFRRAAGCFGRSALMLSGAGSRAPFHIGVARALVEQDLLPNVISGASGGAVVTAILGTHTGASLSRALSADEPGLRFDALDNLETLPYSQRRIDIEDLQGLLEESVPDLTFIEAFEETGRHINISVAPAQVHQRSRLLNATTSPNACIREAVLASCAIPSIFPPVTLAARDAAGQRQPYVPSRQWIDGSITDDLPARRLARLYSVNHFITSQTNPLALWMLPDPHAQDDLFTRWLTIYQSAAREWLRALYPFVLDLVRNVEPLNRNTRLLFGLATQEYTADINIFPRQRVFDPDQLLARLSADETRSLIVEGERATWPKVEMIRNCTTVSRQIDGALMRLG